MKRKALLVVLIICLLGTSVFANGSTETKATEIKEQKKVTLKMGHQIAATSPEGIAAQKFADMVKEKSNGSIEIIVYPQEQLGAAAVMLDSTVLGTLDIAMVASQFLATYDKSFNMVNIPYFFANPDTYRKVLHDSGVDKTQIENLEAKGLHLVNTDRNFFRGDRLIASKKPISSIKDLEGLRFRTFENAIYVESYKRLKTNPLVVAWGETYAALQQNLVEASCCSIDQLYAMGFANVCPYMTWTREYYTEVSMVINSDVWGKLTPEQQKILTECANEAGNVMKSEIEKSTQADIDRIVKESGAKFTEMDTKPLRDALTPYYYELEAEGIVPKGVVDVILAN